MIINIATLFPNMFTNIFDESIIKKAKEKGLIKINVMNIRDFATGKHKVVDDYSFGGGSGMVLKPEPLFRLLDKLRATKIIYLSPQGKTLTQNIIKDLSQEKEITFIAGHYEGIDERIIKEFVDMEISIGDYVLTGGEIPAMVLVDSITRMIPGVINKESLENDSFYNNLLDHPHYTRPASYKGHDVPEVLLNGNHKEIKKWRRKKALIKTSEERPDLLKSAQLTKEDKTYLDKISKEKDED